MDYTNDTDPWEWQGEDYLLPKGSNLHLPQCLWDGVADNDNISYMFDETTPLKACGDLAYNITNNESTSKEQEECRQTSSQVKRRRMLQFNAQDVEPSIICNEDMPSAFLKSKERENFLEDALPEATQWVSGFPDSSASGYDGVEHSPDGWLVDCLNDAEMQCSPDDMNFASDLQIDVTEFCKVSPELEANVVQQCVPRTPRNIVFKGRKSYIRTPTKLASSIAYPFAFIKPCGAHGDVTLKDINQRIQTPPSKSSESKEDSCASYPTSAFSGKPVVGKTKIRTEGGKGSITIMRTKG